VTTTAPSYQKKPPKFLAGPLCLEFVNTVTWRGDPNDRGERLTSYLELLLWAVHAGILDAGASKRLLADADRRPAAADAVVRRAVELRESLASLVLGAERGAAARAVSVLNAMLAAAPPRSAIRAYAEGYSWSEDAHDPTLDSPLHPVIWSAADLLTSGRLAHVRRCVDTRCGWVFLDTSPSGRRRWCSMKECGNRAKVRRHHRRTKAAGRGKRSS
jgi:predicted RNA-binding Zn ribbon-like protein